MTNIRLLCGCIFLGVLACFLSLGTFRSTAVPSAIQVDKSYVFRQAWVWSFRNEWIPEDEFGHAGEITVYHDSLSGSWLFTPESYGTTNEMAHWILIPSPGLRITAYRDEFGDKCLYRDTLDLKYEQSPEASIWQEALFALGTIKVFGTNSYGWPTIIASAYEYRNEENTITSSYYLTETDIDFSPVYTFNNWSGDAKLPFYFPQNIPGSLIVAQETTQDAGRTISVRLEAISDTEYYINLHDYEKQCK